MAHFLQKRANKSTPKLMGRHVSNAARHQATASWDMAVEILSAIETRLSTPLTLAGFHARDTLLSAERERLEYARVGLSASLLLTITHVPRHRLVLAELVRQPVAAKGPWIRTPEDPTTRHWAWQHAKDEDAEEFATSVAELVSGWLAADARSTITRTHRGTSRQAS